MQGHNRETLAIYDSKGFTLIELAISVLVFSVLLGFFITAVSTFVTLDKERMTLARMEAVANALTVFAQQQTRLPCPADPENTPAGGEPFGTERGSGPDGTATGNCLGGPDSRRVGIVPFATLGLSEFTARDAWGNLLTYSVSPSATLDPLTTNYDDYELADWCRYRPVWHDGTAHLGPAKAGFCCGTWHADTAPAQDIVLQGPDGPMQTVLRTGPNRGGLAAEYAPATSAPPDRSDLEESFTPVYVGYVLVSHGENGLLGNSPAELGNLDNTDLEFFVTDRVSPVSGSVRDLKRPDIDDLVFWKTTAQLMGQLGNESCVRP